MKFGIFGTGTVGETIGSALVGKGHEVRIGSRTADNEKAVAWAEKHGDKASYGTFEDAAAFGEILFNCTAGHGAVAAVESAGAANTKGKVLIDVTNPLDFSKGFPPTLFVSNDDSLGERVQKAAPDAKVVKALNTVTASVMVDAGHIQGEHAIFLCGNDAGAKGAVSRLLSEQFGWKQVLDLGDITNARATESYLPLWLRIMGALKTAAFNIRIVKA